MRFGLGLPQRKGADLKADITRTARDAEAAGFDSLWVYERLLFPTAPADGLYGIEGLPWPSCYEGAADPLTVLTAAAAVTDRIRLGSSVLCAPLHHPVRLAKALATIDQVSGGGRLIAGLGAGWSSDELAAMGATLGERGRDLDETLDVLAAVWGADPVSYTGRRASIRSALVYPKPAARIPVLLGAGPAALDRIARRADGWLPVAVPAAALAGMWAGIREAAAGYGRDAGALQMIARANVALTDGPAGDGRPPFTGDLGQVAEDAAAYARAGADELVIDVQGQDDFKGGSWLLDTALEIRDRARAAGA
jgi:probable F420-dependent oxidoreductase